MARRFCITEEQYKRIIGEGVLPNGKVGVNVSQEEINKYGGFDTAVSKNAEVLKKAGASQQGIDNNVEFSTKANIRPSKDDKVVKDTTTKNLTNDGEATPSATGSAIAENKLISKKELMENRLKALKKNSQLYTVKDFMNKIKK